MKLKKPSSCLLKIPRVWSVTLVVAFAFIQLQDVILVLGGESEAGESCHMRELELCCVGSAALLQNPNGLPVTQAELKRQCEFLNESVQCFRDYGDRCLTENHHKVINMFADGIFSMEKEFCSNGSQLRENYMKHASCLRQVQKKHQRECVSDLQAGFESIHKLNNGNRLITACCNINRLRDCVLPRIQENCGQEAQEMAKAFLTRAVGSALHKVCRDYDPTSPTCTALLPKSGTKPSNSRSTSAISRTISSYVMPTQ